MTKKEAHMQKRNELSTISNALKKADLLGFNSVNEALTSLYIEQTGQKEFNSSWKWNEKGMKVKKGEKAFAVWGRPNQKKKKEGVEENEDDTGFSGFPLAYIFHAGQVEPMSEKHKAFFEKKLEAVKAKQAQEEEKKVVSKVEPEEELATVEPVQAKETKQDLFVLPECVEIKPALKMKSDFFKGGAVTKIDLEHDSIPNKFFKIETYKTGKKLVTSIQCHTREQFASKFCKTYPCGDPLSDDFEKELSSVDCARATSKAFKIAHEAVLIESKIEELKKECLAYYAKQQEAKKEA